MYILTVYGKEREGAYSVKNDEGDQILYLFEEDDDAMRYAMQLEEGGYPEMHVLEIDEEMMLKTLELHDHKYAVISKNDIVIPPENANDYL